MKLPASSRSPWLTLAAVLLASSVPILVLWRGVFQGVFFQADLVVYYYPAYTYATRVLRTGILPLWAPEMEGGQPFHAQWEPTLLYPVDVSFRFLLPPWWALNASLLFHSMLAAATMFAYARRLSLSRAAALVSAALYSVNGFMIAHLEHPNLIVGAAWLPLLLLAVEHGLNGQPLAGALGIGAVVGMMLLGGHPDLFLMGALLAGLLLLFHPTGGLARARRPRQAAAPVAMVVGGYLLGLALAAAQLLPTLGLARLAWERHGASVAFQDTWSLRPQQLLMQLLPDLYGRNGQDTYWGFAHYWEECTYMGALALGLALAGLVSRHRLARFYGGVAALGVWLAMGTNGLAFTLLRQVPGFGTMRLPCRYMFLFVLAVAVLAGCGTHWLCRWERPREQGRARWLRGALAVALAAVCGWLSVWWLDRERLLGSATERLVAMHRLHASDLAPIVRQYAQQLGLDVALLLGGLVLALVLALISTRSPRQRSVIPLLAWAGVVGTLFLFGSGYHTVIPARLLEEEPFTVRAIRSAAPEGPFRVLQWDSLRLHANVAVHRGGWPRDDRGYRQYIAALPGNYNLVWGLASVRQEEWSALPLSHTRRLTSAILAKGERAGFQSLIPYLQWWNTQFVISLRPLAARGLRPVVADRTRLYQTMDDGERAWIVHQASVETDEDRLAHRLIEDPVGLRDRVALLSSAPDPVRAGAGSGAGVSGETARMVARSATRVTVEARLDRAGYLVLGETWAPGWRAWVDGQPAPILRANVVHRAVALERGPHRIEFRYQPAEFRLGLYTTCAAIALLLALAVGMGRRRK